jgi:condensin complex subunit 1
MIKVYASKVFNLSMPEDVNSFSVSDSIDQMNQEASDHIVDESQNNVQEANDKALQLSKLCFMVGHVAVKEIVHLEAIESEWKRRKYLGIFFINLIIRPKRC